MRAKKVNESTLKFSDGMEFDTSGELRLEEREDGWYIIGEGKLIPVKNKVEGERMIQLMKLKNNGL